MVGDQAFAPDLDREESGMKLPRRTFLNLAASAAVLPALPRIVRAQDYPSRPVRIMIGFPPGGAADITARIISQWLTERLGQQVIVENRPGAATNIAIQAAIASPPDGYTLVYVTSSTAINATLFESLPFDYLRDLAPVAGALTGPMVVDVHSSVAATNVAQLIALAKANPGKINMASYGTGTTSHLAGELFKSMTGVNMLHVPYRGAAQAHIDLMSGRVQVMFDTLTASLPNIRSGAFRALAVTSKTRFEPLPDVPTVAETVPGYDASVWGGFCAPRGTPPEIIERLNREINAGFHDPQVKAQLAAASNTPLPLGPAEFGAFLAAETEKWGKVVKSSGVRPE
jgi:tripartite-type tricarboxylate transporter receptor subunit TctC